MKNHSQDSQSSGQNLNSGPLKYEAGVLTTRPQRSVLMYVCTMQVTPLQPVLSVQQGKVLSFHTPGETEENHEQFWSEAALFWPRSEHAIP
jgi:hypothetical protein